MSPKPIPPRCPSCTAALSIAKLTCTACATEITGQFDPCPVCRLTGEARQVFEHYLAARGNVRQVQHALGVSYPTARQRVDDMFNQLNRRTPLPEPMAILKKVRSGEIDLETAERLLRGDEPSTTL